MTDPKDKVEKQVLGQLPAHPIINNIMQKAIHQACL